MSGTYVQIYMHTYIRISKSSHNSSYTYIHTYFNIYIHTYIRISIYIYIHTYVFQKALTTNKKLSQQFVVLSQEVESIEEEIPKENKRKS